MSKYVVISGPYFPVFGLNTEIYGVNDDSMINDVSFQQSQNDSKYSQILY